MRVKYIGKSQMDYIVKNNDIDLTPDEIYTVLEESEKDYRIIDDSGDDYLYPKSFFKIIE